MEKRIETTIIYYIGTTIRIQSFIPSYSKVRFRVLGFRACFLGSENRKVGLGCFSLIQSCKVLKENLCPYVFLDPYPFGIPLGLLYPPIIDT